MFAAADKLIPFYIGVWISQRRSRRSSNPGLWCPARGDLRDNQANVRIRPRMPSALQDFQGTLYRKLTVYPCFSGVHHGSVAEGFETSLKALGVGYIDLYVS